MFSLLTIGVFILLALLVLLVVAGIGVGLFFLFRRNPRPPSAATEARQRDQGAL